MTGEMGGARRGRQWTVCQVLSESVPTGQLGKQ